jgi:ribonuclease-3
MTKLPRDGAVERQSSRAPRFPEAGEASGAHETRPLAELEEVIDYTFSNPQHLQNALVHKSYLHEVADFELGSNERLEFLGDSVIGLIVSAALFRSRPNASEGELSALRGALVRKETLAEMAANIGLGDFLTMSHGEEIAGGRSRTSNLARAAEALLGAVYVDGGLDAAEHVWYRLAGEDDDERLQQVLRGDFKSRLQQITQAVLKLTPSYRLISTSGPEHSKEFAVEVVVGTRTLARGTGRSKQSAEQAAAQAALLEPEFAAQARGVAGV